MKLSYRGWREPIQSGWEEDAMEWDYRLKELTEWMQKLEDPLCNEKEHEGGKQDGC